MSAQAAGRGADRVLWPEGGHRAEGTANPLARGSDVRSSFCVRHATSP